MAGYQNRSDLQVADELVSFLEDSALPGSGVDRDAFWSGFSQLVHEFGPQNRALLETRQEIQDKIDAYHVARRDAFEIDTANVDPEIASVPGPQLVVPITNARYALNAANARWGSLYDGFYGTDAMGTPAPKGGYDQGRGARVVARARVFLDEAFPIERTSHADARRYIVHKGALLVDDLPLSEPEKFVGYTGHPKAPDSIVLRNNGLHVKLVFDRTHPIGGRDQAGLADSLER